MALCQLPQRAKESARFSVRSLISALFRSSVTRSPRTSSSGLTRLPRKSTGRFQGCGRPRTTWSPSLEGLYLQDSYVPPSKAGYRILSPEQHTQERGVLPQLEEGPAWNSLNFRCLASPKTGAHPAHLTEVIRRRQQQFSALPQMTQPGSAQGQGWNPQSLECLFGEKHSRGRGLWIPNHRALCP